MKQPTRAIVNTSTKESPSKELISRRKSKCSSRVCKERAVPETEKRNPTAMQRLPLGLFSPALIDMNKSWDAMVATNTRVRIGRGAMSAELAPAALAMTRDSALWLDTSPLTTGAGSLRSNYGSSTASEHSWLGCWLGNGNSCRYHPKSWQGSKKWVMTVTAKENTW